MTIAQKFTLSCTSLVAMTAVLGTVSLITVRRIDHMMTSTVVDAMPGIYEVGKAERASKNMRSKILMLLSATSNAETVRLEQEIKTYADQFKTILKTYEKTIVRHADRELFNRIEPAFDRFMTIEASVQSLAAKSRLKEANALYKTSASPAFDELQKTISDEIDQNNAYGAELTVQSASTASASYIWIWSILGLVLLTGGGIAIFMARGIKLTLERSVEELSEGAEQVASAAAQVSAASQSTAQGASEQASSLEETSASAQEISSMTRQNAHNSRSAAEGMMRAEQRVIEANKTLEDMIASMGEINESSQKISKIIKVIDEIAFQTNILALNAAVEAARAGEAGMGFAVVADEVRNLAQRSAQAAKDTSTLIAESVAKSSEGSNKLSSVVAAIRGVTEEASKAKTLVDEVTTASAEQSQGMDQISKSITEMERVTQRNAASSEESASASEELTAQAVRVKDVVAQLRSMVKTRAAEKQSAPPLSRHSHTEELGNLNKAVSQDRGMHVSYAEQEIPFEQGSFKELA